MLSPPPLSEQRRRESSPSIHYTYHVSPHFVAPSTRKDDEHLKTIPFFARNGAVVAEVGENLQHYCLCSCCYCATYVSLKLYLHIDARSKDLIPKVHNKISPIPCTSEISKKAKIPLLSFLSPNC